MTPLDYYHEQCRQGSVTEDKEQLTALHHLQTLYHALLNERHHRDARFAIFRKAKLVDGLYLWGGVGIGKTFLMDCFFHSLPFTEKMRLHFHPFMQLVHQALTKYQGKKNPLQLVAKEFANKTMVLCFDELFVTDITDAMILGRLFHALFKEGVTLVATSNAMPDDLYKNGLQRKLFLPAIQLLKQHMKVIEMKTTLDYRLRHLKTAGVYYLQDEASSLANMEKSFTVLADNAPIYHDPIEINNRQIAIKKETRSMVWFDFETLCQTPRSQQDYLAIAKKYHTVFISDIPIIREEANDTITLFIRLIDVLYDARTRVVLSAADHVDQLYRQGLMIKDYARTRSRLLEMQSEHYFWAC